MKVRLGAPRYRRREEMVNTLSHGVGVVLSVVGLAVLSTLATIHGTVWHVVGCTVYGVTLVLLYLASTLYHGLPLSRAKVILQSLDHSAIYLLIAGTYTPFTLVHLRGPWGWSLFGVVWGLALLGILSRATILSRRPAVSVAFYIAMGWVARGRGQTDPRRHPRRLPDLDADGRRGIHGGGDLLRLGASALQPRRVALLCPGGQCLPVLRRPAVRRPGRGARLVPFPVRDFRDPGRRQVGRNKSAQFRHWQLPGNSRISAGTAGLVPAYFLSCPEQGRGTIGGPRRLGPPYWNFCRPLHPARRVTCSSSTSSSTSLGRYRYCIRYASSGVVFVEFAQHGNGTKARFAEEQLRGEVGLADLQQDAVAALRRELADQLPDHAAWPRRGGGSREWTAKLRMCRRFLCNS